MKEVRLSIDLVWGEKKPLLAFVVENLGEDIDFGPCLTLGVLLDSVLSGVVVFHDWQRERGTVEITGVAISAKWLSRRVVNEIAQVCYGRLNVNQVVARCDARNVHTTRIFNALGFKPVRLPNMRGRGLDEIFFYQTKDDWLNERFSK